MPGSLQAGDVLADRYRLDDLLAENGAARFWRAHDLILHRPVAVHILSADDDHAEPLLEAARRAGPVADRRLLRVLDAEVKDGFCFVVCEWGQGESLDILLVREGPLSPRRAAWLVAEVAESVAAAHDAGRTHGRLVPENVLIDLHGQVRIIGCGVDAALRGLPPERFDVDVIDLAALLYCALTGKWPGVSESVLPPAPEEHGAVLRPRRVRAGIPRALDTLCDQALAHDRVIGGSAAGMSARGIADELLSYVGDMTGSQVAMAAVRATPPMSPVVAEPAPIEPESGTTGTGPVESVAEETSRVPEPTPTEAVPTSSGPTSSGPTSSGPTPSGPTPSGPTPSVDLPTQAGMPVFHDDDEVDWLRARTDPVAPPPPLADLPPKPLFAPEPPEGEPVRRPRPGSRAASATSDYWPWDSSQDSGVRPPSGGDTGSWTSGSSPTGSWSADRWSTGEGLDDTGEHVPGRKWFRLAMIVAVIVLLMVAAVAIYQLGLKPPPDDPPVDAVTSSPTVAEPTPFADVAVVDFDPQGAEPREENPDLVPNVLDGDPATSWHTSTYKQNFGPAGLKSGVGLILDLGLTKGVRQVRVSTEGGPTSLAAYVTVDAPTGVADLSPVGTASGNGDLTINLDEAISGRYVTIWLTLLPAVSDGFRGTVTEVQVLG